MKLILRLFVPGEPRGKGRARSVALRNSDGSLKTRMTANGKQAPLMVHMTDDKTRTYEGMIKSLAVDRIVKPSSAPIYLELIIGMPIPKSWPSWKASAAISGEIEPTAKPDSDNVLKAVKDALNGVVWNDDCQVVICHPVKKFVRNAGILIRAFERPTLPSTIKTKKEYEQYRNLIQE